MLLLAPTLASAKNYYIATNGNDNHAGTLSSPFATLRKAQSLVVAGDTVFIRGGVYKISPEEVMREGTDIYIRVFDMSKSFTSDNKRSCYWGYANKRLIFQLFNPPNNSD